VTDINKQTSNGQANKQKTTTKQSNKYREFGTLHTKAKRSIPTNRPNQQPNQPTDNQLVTTALTKQKIFRAVSEK